MDHVKVSLRKARADIRLKPGATLDVKKLRKAVIKAGFTPTWVRFEAAGHLTQQNGRTAFKVKGIGQIIPLEETQIIARLRRKASGKEVTITVVIPAKKQEARVETFKGA